MIVARNIQFRARLKCQRNSGSSQKITPMRVVLRPAFQSMPENPQEACFQERAEGPSHEIQ